jgi:hypothetical protein
MVEKQFASRPPDQYVQDIQEPGRQAQLALHDRAPGPHSVESLFNIRDTKAFRCLSFTGTVTRVLSIEEAGGAILA